MYLKLLLSSAAAMLLMQDANSMSMVPDQAAHVEQSADQIKNIDQYRDILISDEAINAKIQDLYQRIDQSKGEINEADISLANEIRSQIVARKAIVKEYRQLLDTFLRETETSKNAFIDLMRSEMPKQSVKTWKDAISNTKTDTKLLERLLPEIAPALRNAGRLSEKITQTSQLRDGSFELLLQNMNGLFFNKWKSYSAYEGFITAFDENNQKLLRSLSDLLENASKWETDTFALHPISCIASARIGCPGCRISVYDLGYLLSQALMIVESSPLSGMPKSIAEEFERLFGIIGGKVLIHRVNIASSLAQLTTVVNSFNEADKAARVTSKDIDKLRKLTDALLAGYDSSDKSQYFDFRAELNSLEGKSAEDCLTAIDSGLTGDFKEIIKSLLKYIVRAANAPKSTGISSGIASRLAAFGGQATVSEAKSEVQRTEVARSDAFKARMAMFNAQKTEDSPKPVASRPVVTPSASFSAARAAFGGQPEVKADAQIEAPKAQAVPSSSGKSDEAASMSFAERRAMFGAQKTEEATKPAAPEKPAPRKLDMSKFGMFK